MSVSANASPSTGWQIGGTRGPSEGGLFVLPVAGEGRKGPVAAWVTTAGLARAVEKRLGWAEIVSPLGRQSPLSAYANATPMRVSQQPANRKGRTPQVLITAAKDVRNARRAWLRRHVIANDRTMPVDSLRFVWQRHELFHDEGLRAARLWGVPSVLSVHAVQVDEAAAWGVRRPLWGRPLRHASEVRRFRSADLVTTVSDALAAAVASCGVEEKQILVLPNGVDTAHFRRMETAALRTALGLDDLDLVVGWSGSFRGFHGLSYAVEAVAAVQRSGYRVGLLLLGDGVQRKALLSEANAMGVRDVVSPGTVSYEDMPKYLNCMDVGLVLSNADEGFHYSPVKLREYAATGRAIIAHRIGQMQQELDDGVDSLLVAPGNASQLASAMRKLIPLEVHSRLGQAARHKAEREWDWTQRVDDLLNALSSREAICKRGKTP